MKDIFFRILIKKLILFCGLYNMDVIRNDKLYLVLQDYNYYLILPKFTHLDFIKVYFVSKKTYKPEIIYRTKLIYYRNVLREIKKLIILLNYKQINEE